MASSASIVISTFNRADSLERTLQSLRYLDYPNFEVIVVNGPSTDGTEKILTKWKQEIKVGACAEINLSVSRNIGIAMASGEIVAFIDDDAIPEPEWLSRIMAGYENDEVAGVGGATYDYDGYRLHSKFIISNRSGGYRFENKINPTPYYNFPHSEEYCAHLGTISSFRRDVLFDIGGFDEEFDYYLDETDVCIRMIDNGYVIKFVDDAFIHHKFLPSHIRNEHRFPKNWYPIIKNTVYFACKNALQTQPFHKISSDVFDFIEDKRRAVIWAIDNQVSSPEEQTVFEDAAERAVRDGFIRGLSQPRKLISREILTRNTGQVQRFPILMGTKDKLTICFLSQDFPPSHNGGIARFTCDLASGIARFGHVVHVLTTGREHNTVDFENGVWVHRILIKDYHPSHIPEDYHSCRKNFNYSKTVHEELKRIDSHHHIDIIEAPIWDTEGIDCVIDDEFKQRTVISLQTTIKIGAESNLEWSHDPDKICAIENEEYVLRNARWFHAISSDIVKSVRQKYRLDQPESCFGYIPLGIQDRSGEFTVRSGEADSLTVLFVGRLERRKGIDVLLQVMQRLLLRHPHVRLVVVGRDDIKNEKGITYKEEFLQTASEQKFLKRVEFMGRVPDEELFHRYAECDLFVAPSRYESFGLIFLEAMMFGKPVIGCRAGGMVEIIEDGGNGFLVEQGDAHTLESAIEQLIKDPALRKRFGVRSRQIYEERFTDEIMVQHFLAFFKNRLKTEESQKKKHLSPKQVVLNQGI